MFEVLSVCLAKSSRLMSLGRLSSARNKIAFYRMTTERAILDSRIWRAIERGKANLATKSSLRKLVCEKLLNFYILLGFRWNFQFGNFANIRSLIKLTVAYSRPDNKALFSDLGQPTKQQCNQFFNFLYLLKRFFLLKTEKNRRRFAKARITREIRVGSRIDQTSRKCVCILNFQLLYSKFGIPSRDSLCSSARLDPAARSW